MSCCFMMLEATLHGENERILDAPWHEVQQWRNARRTALNDRRARYLSMHRAGSRVLTWDAHSDFPFFFSFLFIFSCLVLFRRKYSSLRLSRDLPTGQMCQIPNTAWSLCQERVPACDYAACWRNGLFVALSEGKRKRVSGGYILNRGRSEKKRMRRYSMRACSQGHTGGLDH